MKAKLNKILSVVITLCMLAGMLPGVSLTAFATTGSGATPQVRYNIGEAYKYTSGSGAASLTYGTPTALESTAVSSVDGNVVTLSTTTRTDDIDKNYKLIYVPVEVTVAVPANTAEYYVRHNIEVAAQRVVANTNATATASAAVYYLGESDASSELTFYPYYDNTQKKADTDAKELGMACQGQAGDLQQSFSDSFEQTICYENSTNTDVDVTHWFGVMLVITSALTHNNTATADFTFTAEEAHGHDGVVFTEWTATDSLPTTAGNYCLANNVTLTNQWSAPSGETNLCLNGHTITQEDNKSAICVYSGATLSIYDCGTGGKITHAENIYGRGIYISGGTLNLHSGAIAGNKDDNIGAGVYMDNGIFNMFGGSITDNEEIYSGGGAFIAGGEFNMTGGEITGNKAEACGGICYSSGTITVSGKVIISGNYKTDGTTPSNLQFVRGKTLTIGTLASGSEIGVTTYAIPATTSPVVLTANAIDESNRDTYKAYFTSDNSAYTIDYNASGKMQLTAPAAHTHDDVTFDKWTAASGELASGNYYLAESNATPLAGNITIPDGVAVNLCLNGKTLDMGGYYINNCGTLTICDCQTAQGKITGTSNYGVVYNNYGDMNMLSGTIDGNIALRNRSCTVNISGGKVLSKYAIQHNDYAVLTVSGTAEITGEATVITSSESSRIEITGGTIQSTGGNGINNYGTLDITGGVIKAEADYFGIYNLGNATASGGEVKGGVGIDNGMGYTLEIDGTAQITGTSDYGVQTEGNLAVKGGTISGAITAVEIRDGSAEISGGLLLAPRGIRNCANLTVLTGANIENGIFNYCGTLDLKGGSVTCEEYSAIENYDGLVYLSGTPVISGNDCDILHNYRDYYHIYASDLSGTLYYSGDDLRIAIKDPEDYVVGNAVLRGYNEANKGKFVLVGNEDYSFKEGTAIDTDTNEPYDALVVALAHTHSWSTDWTFNGTHHWHECTADGCDITENSQKDSYAEHSFTNGFCTCGVHKHTDGTILMPLTVAGGELNTGNYYLADNLTATDIITIPEGATVNLCLNGKTLDMGSYYIKNNGTLTICDCQNTEGSITSKNSENGIISNTGTLTINAGNIKYVGDAEYAYSIDNSGYATVNGGVIDGITDNHSELEINGGTFTNSGSYSTIQNHRYLYINGGRIENDDACIFNYCAGVDVTGGTIISTNSVAISNYDGLTYLSGTPTIVGDETEYADLMQHGSSGYYIYAHSVDGSAVYSGEKLTVKFDSDSSYTIGKVAIAGVDDTTKDKFTLLGNENYKLVRGTGENENNLVVALAHNHNWSSDWTFNGTHHWHECTADGCDITEDSQKDSYAEHTPNADDGDCTTAITCSFCGDVTTAAKSHAFDDSCDTDCNNAGCDHTREITHTPNADDGDCTTAISCSVCGVETTAAKSHAFDNACDTDCNNTDCTHTRQITHTPNEDDGDCTTAISCSVCGVETTAAKSHVFDNACDTDCNNTDCTHTRQITHTPNADDGDCTTAITCSVCGEETTAAKSHAFDNSCDTDCNNTGCDHTRQITHTPNADDGDCTTAITCSICGVETTAAKSHAFDNACDTSCNNEDCTHTRETTHTPNEDDGDCTTAITCSVCGEETTAAQSHAFDDSCDTDCNNAGCDHTRQITHTPNADDGDCTTAISCSVCGVETTAAKSHAFDNACDTDCNNSGCNHTRQITHTPNEDDGDCTTAITCSVCGVETTASKSHAFDNSCDTDCNNTDCTHTREITHTPNEDDGDCTTAISCSVCGVETTAAKSHAFDDSCDTDCNNAGCDHTRQITHTPNEDDGDCTTAIHCGICNVITTAAKSHAFDNACDTDCNNEDCTHTRQITHTPNADDGDCTTAISCSVCGEETTAAKSHAFDNSCDTDCNNTGCDHTRQITHIPNADDGDCTTAIKCSVCQAETTAAKSHAFDNACDTDCNNSGCTHTRQITHTPNEDDGDCTTAISCSVCGVETTASKSHVFDNACDTDCNNAGCDHTRQITHTPNEDDGDCTTAIHCGICNVITTAAKSHSFTTASTAEASTATCLANKFMKAKCDNCNAVSDSVKVEVAGTMLSHSYTYAKTSDTVITETCTNGCSHTAMATISAPTGTLVYDGNAKIAAVTYSDNWQGGTLDISYNDNINAGAVTATITKDTAEAEVDYTITQATPIITNPTASRVRRGNTLSNSTLTGGAVRGVDADGNEIAITGTFAWKDGAEVMNTNGTFLKTVVFTPDSIFTNYKACEFDVDVEVYSSSGSGTTRYTVKFETNGGSTIKSVTVNRNGKVTEPAEPAKDGFVFDGWYTDKELTKKYDFTSKVTKSFTLYASWSEIIIEPDPDTENPGTDDNELKWNPFIDVTENDWFHDVIKKAYLADLVNGTTDTTFTPDGNITRGMFVTILYRAEGEPVAPKLNFTDVAGGQYYCDAIAWANANGIVKGVSETEFAPDDNITREQMAAILFRYAKYKNADVSVGENTNILSYTDAFDITEYAITAMQWSCGEGIISGKGNGILDPLGNATRAEATAALIRFLYTIK